MDLNTNISMVSGTLTHQKELLTSSVEELEALPVKERQEARHTKKQRFAYNGCQVTTLSI